MGCEVVAPLAVPLMYMSRVSEVSPEARVVAMVSNDYSLYTDTMVTYDYLDFMTRWVIPSCIYDMVNMPLPPTTLCRGTSRLVGSSNST